MLLKSEAPHDFYLALDCASYFKLEDDPEVIYTVGYVRPLSLADRDVLSVTRFNGDPDEPEFSIEFPDSGGLSKSEEQQARDQITRILGLNLNLTPLMESALDDPVIGPLLTDHYGFKRISGASVFEDAFTDIVKTRISHKPTAKRMDQDLRRTYGTAFEYNGTTYYAYPRYERLRDVDPADFREHGVSKRKAEYVIGMARSIADGELDLTELEALEPHDFYDAIQKVRGIGPSTAQTLMLSRGRADAAFPSNAVKGKEKGLRRWIIRSYGYDPDAITDTEFEDLIARWGGHEALAIEYLYYDWILSELASKS